MKCYYCGSKGEDLTVDAYGHEACEECVAPCEDCGEEVPCEELTRTQRGPVCRTCLDSYYHKCDDCGYWTEETINTPEGEICLECIDDHYTVCECCDEYTHSEDMRELGRDDVCCACFENFAVRCDDCGGYFHADETVSDDWTIICDDCREQWNRCTRCNDLVHDMDVYVYDDDPYCDRCAEDMEDDEDRLEFIRNHDYRPMPRFYSHEESVNHLFMGIELEIDGGGCNDANAKHITSDLGDRVYCKTDGSLDCGFEIVSHPMTLGYIKDTEEPWRAALKKAKLIGYKSHDCKTCGIHVHIGRDYLDKEEHVAKLVYLVEKFWNQVARFTRRSPGKLDQWAKRYMDKEPSNVIEAMDEAKGKRGKYFAVNISPRYTVEIRVFRGTLKFSTFMATIEFCHLLAVLAKEKSLQEVQALIWSDIIKEAEEYDYLYSYLEQRDLVPECAEETSPAEPETDIPFADSAVIFDDPLQEVQSLYESSYPLPEHLTERTRRSRELREELTRE